MDEHFIRTLAVAFDEIADRHHALFGKGARADAVMQVLKPQGPSLFAFLRSIHRLIGLAVVPKVDDPAISLLFELGQVGLGGLISDRNFGCDARMKFMFDPQSYGTAE